MDFEIFRSKRKTVSIQITRDARLVVRAPLKMPQSRIDDFVERHEPWIAKHLENANRELENKRQFTFADGQSVYFIGKRYKICADNYITHVEIIDNQILFPAKLKDCEREQAFVRFLSGQARETLPRRASLYAAQMGVSPQSVSITSAKTRWGSCSGKNRVCFSFRLICLPQELIDYVVVHELAHITEHNHSQKFYAHIAKILPDYKLLQKKLKAFGRLLLFN